MSRDACEHAPSDDLLVAWWLGELGEPERARVDEHLFACGRCGAALEELAGLAHGIRAAVRSGRLRGVVGATLPQRLADAGLRVREYRVACNGSVHCTVAPDDDVVITRLQAELAGIERIDVATLAADGAELHRLEDVPFAAPAGEIVLLPDIAELRALPATTLRMRLVAVGRDAPRVIGEYAFHHTPWSGPA